MTRKRKQQKKGKKRTRKKTSQSPKKAGRRFVGFAVVAMLALAVYFAVIGGEYTVLQIRQLEALQEERAAELAHAGARIDSLRHLAEQLRNDAEAIERVARERYGMIRDGETLYRFREAAPRAGSIDEPKEPE